MPTATFDLIREGKCVVVRIAPKTLWVKQQSEAGVITSPPSVLAIEAPLPLELAAFCTSPDRCRPCSSFPTDHPLYGQGLAAVWLDLPKDRSGVDVTPMLVAADWLRDRGWTVEPIGWCKSEMERREAV